MASYNTGWFLGSGVSGTETNWGYSIISCVFENLRLYRLLEGEEGHSGHISFTWSSHMTKPNAREEGWEPQGSRWNVRDQLCLCHLEVQFLGCRVYEYSVLQDNAKLFSKALMQIYTINKSVQVV